MNNSQDPCWKRPGSDMMLWAEQHEKVNGNTHGLGNLKELCIPRSGETCPACGKVWN
jgi:hypothetical protein